FSISGAESEAAARICAVEERMPLHAGRQNPFSTVKPILRRARLVLVNLFVLFFLLNLTGAGLGFRFLSYGSTGKTEQKGSQRYRHPRCCSNAHLQVSVTMTPPPGTASA